MTWSSFCSCHMTKISREILSEQKHNLVRKNVKSTLVLGNVLVKRDISTVLSIRFIIPVVCWTILGKFLQLFFLFYLGLEKEFLTCFRLVIRENVYNGDQQWLNSSNFLEDCFNCVGKSRRLKVKIFHICVHEQHRVSGLSWFVLCADRGKNCVRLVDIEGGAAVVVVSLARPSSSSSPTS